MEKIGLFEAKTRLSEICERVSRLGEPVLVTKRGEPWVRIEPITPKGSKEDVWDRRKKFEEEFGPLTEDFELPKRQINPPKNFFDA